MTARVATARGRGKTLWLILRWRGQCARLDFLTREYEKSRGRGLFGVEIRRCRFES